ncbi:MAG: hypothetical protein ACI9VT_002903 [Psychroserpens sp.]|jgi:hypothetical protein
MQVAVSKLDNISNNGLKQINCIISAKFTHTMTISLFLAYFSFSVILLTKAITLINFYHL